MDPPQHTSTMTQLIYMGDGIYTFGSTEALKEFLTIDGKCVANATRARCKIKRGRAVKEIQPQLEKIVSTGFPSGKASFHLKKCARECICGWHKSKNGHIYKDWTHRLWVAYLEKNGVDNIPVGSVAPALEDKEKWKEVLRQLKRQPPAQAGMRPVLQTVLRKRLTLVKQMHLTQNEKPPPLIQTRTTPLVGGLA